MRDATFDELCTALFASLPRADQRSRGAEYLHGLLSTPGRKSIRNIAAATGGTEQGLHHFVSDSTWDWIPVRKALTQYVIAHIEPRAWVLRPMVIPKAGNQTVGVGRRFDPALGQTLNAQQAVGVWAAAEWTSTPVSWRLHLSQAWLADEDRRGRAAIPAEAKPETFGDCAIAALREVDGRADRPVVLDVREMDVATTLRRLMPAPFLARVPEGLRLSASGPMLPGHGDDTLPAHVLASATKDRRRPLAQSAVVAAITGVELPDVGELTLFCAAGVGGAWPDELWLTNLAAPPAILLRLAHLVRRVDEDFAEIADHVGIRDFSGRSFVGWHRHVTLASAAHAVVAQSGLRRRNAA